ncbi:CARDB domain-containing protein [Halorientalis marina]|jgi:flagellar protein FlaG|uniref:CARDB domain-containing protein n=1 Tax=Halorientalis marina TaxID=2931976 RepID=UPI001FF3A1E2|nr:CARDB domain-containing protein [Halorientalis marina]
MASVSVSHMILFIASIIIAASVAGVFTDSISRVSQAIEDRGGSLSEKVRTDIQVISDSGSTAVYDEETQNITLHIKNTGSATLPANGDGMDVFVDGEYETDVTVTPVEDTDTWRPGGVVRAEIEPNDGGGLTTGDHRVKVIINEDEEVFEFRV